MKDKKKNSKKIGIKLKTNKNNNIYFFNSSDLEEPKYILLEDNGQKLKEIQNNTMLEFQEKNSNKQINLAYKKYNLIYENKYTRDKNNLLNSVLIKQYCKNEVNSNIYIQLIHNNEDIKKIVSLYVNDVIYTLTTINESVDRECISKVTNTYYIKDNKIYTHKGIYADKDLPLVLEELKSRKYMYGFTSSNEKDIFEYIKAISSLRNQLLHFNSVTKYDLHNLKIELSKYIHQKGKEFIKNSKLNISFIMKLYKDSTLKSELKKYYLYVLNQSDKNLGLSIRKIMEQARSIYPSNLDEEASKKYNMLLKYYLYNYLSENKDFVEKYVIKLRESEFEEKELIYQEIVKNLGKEHFDKIKNICEDINYKESTYIDSNIVKEILDIRYDWDEFILKIYALSKFLTIKETNILISSLITN